MSVTSIPSCVACLTLSILGRGGGILRFQTAWRWKVISLVLSVLISCFWVDQERTLLYSWSDLHHSTKLYWADSNVHHHRHQHLLATHSNRTKTAVYGIRQCRKAEKSTLMWPLKHKIQPIMWQIQIIYQVSSTNTKSTIKSINSKLQSKISSVRLTF